MDALNWPTIGAAAASRAIRSGGILFRLATPFYSGGSTFSYGLKTARGTHYRVSDTVVRSLTPTSPGEPAAVKSSES